MPSQKVGMHWPASARAIAPESSTEPRHTAARMPSGSARRTAEDDRHHRELDRRGEAFEDERQRRLTVPEGAAEVALDRAREEVAVLLGQGPVEPEGGPH